MSNNITIRSLQPDEIHWAEALCAEHFASPRVVSRGILHEAKNLSGLIAELNGEKIGLTQYDI
ncbi:MAG: hypothetical protein AAF512_26105, partial [Pseudomonadota bacterium]